MGFLFSLLVMMTGPMLAATEVPLDANVLGHVDQFLAREIGYGVEPGHQSVVRPRRDASGVAVKTKYAVVVVAGLYNSPVSIRPIETHFAAKGDSVISLRLAGHYEADRSAIKNTVRWQTWAAQTVRAVALAREFGDRVILVGHSTGALLLTWRAIEDPRDIAALGILAPAFGIHYVSSPLVWAMNLFKFGKRAPDGRYLTGHAADQVRRLGEAFANEFSTIDVAARLRDVPVWMANTSIDTVIDLKLANQFFAALERTPDAAARVKDVRSWCEGLFHDHLASARNPQLPTLLRSLDEVIPRD